MREVNAQVLHLINQRPLGNVARVADSFRVKGQNVNTARQGQDQERQSGHEQHEGDGVFHSLGVVHHPTVVHGRSGFPVLFQANQSGVQAVL